MDQKLHDSGERRTFSSGAQRDRGTLKPRPDLISPHAQMREGMIFALGAEKYSTRNWELGMEISECLASAQRHIEQWKLGLTDEDHLAQARWNLGAIIHYEEEIRAGRMDPAFADMPHYMDRPHPWPRQKVYPEVSKGPPVLERMCPKCGAHLRQEQYETGTEFFCIYCEWNSLQAEPDSEPQVQYVFGPQTTALLEPRPIRLRCPRCDRPVHQDNYETEIESHCSACGWLGDRHKRPDDPEVSKKTFYICGPMRGLPFLNFPAFDGAKKLGESLGHSIISPADMDRMYGIDPIEDPGSPERVRDATPNFVHSVVERDIEIILRLQKDRGDGLALLPDWQQSVGGMAEVRLAYWLGLCFVDARDWKSIDIELHLGAVR